MPLERDLVEGNPWVFDGDVADSFDEMLERSIPEYDRMRSLVWEVGHRFGVPATDSSRLPTVLDLGCSRGEALAPFAADGWRAAGYEVSEPMYEAARRRFDRADNVAIVRHDLRRPLRPASHADLVLCVLTLMFVPTNYRQRVLEDAYDALRSGGALILVEKVLGAGKLDDVFVNVYHDLKRGNGYSDEEVRRKALALEGVLVPLTAAMNEKLLLDAGFRPTDVFWAHANFRGWVAVRP